MAEEKRGGFPTMPILHWWTLRRKFKDRMDDIYPGILTYQYLARILDMQDAGVQSNILPSLKIMGLIDGDGRTTERMQEWLDDGKYAATCMKILREIYPSSLLDDLPDPRKDRKAVEKWFSSETGLGSVAVGKMAAFYSLLRDGDLKKSPSQSSPKVSEPLLVAEAEAADIPGKGRVEVNRVPGTEDAMLSVSFELRIPDQSVNRLLEQIMRAVSPFIRETRG